MSAGMHTGRNLADRCRMPTISLVTVRALNENTAITETFGKHFATDIVETNASAFKAING